MTRTRLLLNAVVAVAVAVAVGLLPQPAAAATWRWPVRGPVIGAFRLAPERFAAGQHRGIDIAAPVGAPVRSACAGRVRFAGFVGSAGRTVSITCGGLVASYLHLSSIAVRSGAHLRAGDRIGAVGTSGRPSSRRAHLHFGVRRARSRWAYLDPLALLGDPVAGPRGPLPAPGSRRTRGPLGPAPPAVVTPGPAARALVRRVHAAGPRAGLPWEVWAGLALLGPVVSLPLLRGRRSRRQSPAATNALASSASAIQSPEP